MKSAVGARSFGFLLLFIAHVARTTDSDQVLTGDNVCIEQTIEENVVNVTYLQSVSVKEYTWCLGVPPRCPVWKDKLVTRYKEKNVSRVINHQSCCPGYR